MDDLHHRGIKPAQRPLHHQLRLNYWPGIPRIVHQSKLDKYTAEWSGDDLWRKIALNILYAKITMYLITSLLQVFRQIICSLIQSQDNKILYSEFKNSDCSVFLFYNRQGPLDMNEMSAIFAF